MNILCPEKSFMRGNSEFAERLLAEGQRSTRHRSRGCTNFWQGERGKIYTPLVACFYLLQIICHYLFCRHIMVNMYCDHIIIYSVGKYEVAQSCKFLEDSFTHNYILHCLSVGFTSCLFMLYTMPDNYCLL